MTLFLSNKIKFLIVVYVQNEQSDAYLALIVHIGLHNSKAVHQLVVNDAKILNFRYSEFRMSYHRLVSTSLGRKKNLISYKPSLPPITPP